MFGLGKKKSQLSGTRVVATMAATCRREGLYIPDQDGDGLNQPFTEKIANGHLDDVKTGQCYRRLQVSDLMSSLFPAFSCCARCHLPWALVRAHTTWVSPTSGMFPLCEDCWLELKTPDNRLPYYRELFNGRVSGSPPVRESDWRIIESAVFLETMPAHRAQSIHSVN